MGYTRACVGQRPRRPRRGAVRGSVGCGLRADAGASDRRSTCAELSKRRSCAFSAGIEYWVGGVLVDTQHLSYCKRFTLENRMTSFSIDANTTIGQAALTV